MAAGDSATIELDGHRLALTHLRKVLYPATGTTKSDIIAYFAEVAHALIPHLADRPVTRKRWPDGVTTTPFFHKDLPQGHADLGEPAGDPAFRRPEGLPDRRLTGDAGLAGADRRAGTACAAMDDSVPIPKTPRTKPLSAWPVPTGWSSTSTPDRVSA